MSDTDDSRFQIKNGRITRAKGTERVSFLTIHAHAGKFPGYFEVTSFDPCPFGVDDVVTVSGALNMMKPRDGGREWKLQLIARKWESGDPAKAPSSKNAKDTRPAKQTEIGAEPDLSDDVPF